ncbi:MAG: hypothetical protein COS68_07655 [Elusimicrobia bacterium CG06_land_8_20_14_3_00_38_11]|nr:MAG: hypothetical protein COS68_07655 [Elusimicrobia bacterium CG06_land_8_20_14_3_00_38_11]
MNKDVFSFIDFIKSNDGIGNKALLIKKAQRKFKLTRDRSVYYSGYFSVRFSYSSSSGFSNTVISLSNLQKYDDLPFLVCLVTLKKNILYIGNTTFLQKISHSSQDLRVDNIRGSLNGSDIVKEFSGLSNSPENFEKLFSIHTELGFDGNLVRLVEATNNISPSGKKFKISSIAKTLISAAPERAIKFTESKEYLQLKSELDSKVKQYKNEILIAGFIENVNIRGRIIEYLIAGEDEKLRASLIKALHNSNKIIPSFRTKNSLGDYIRIFDKYNTATDIKTKIMVLSSNPKAYNIDKLLEFLSEEKSVFMFYFIGIEPNKIVNQILVSMFQTDLLKSTIILKHWSGRNSRGVTQFEGETIHLLILSPNNKINKQKSSEFLSTLMKL